MTMAIENWSCQEEHSVTWIVEVHVSPHQNSLPIDRQAEQWHEESTACQKMVHDVQKLFNGHGHPRQQKQR